ncbi:hypothetical protein Y032_0013g2147 [Ancylostoma ceylanicum]|uniref:Uncharacterized protein n=1 Tax=Ancylostoma ceylanicum TaxID=53326 RepID=A0A016VDP2_9BILA|nr:hypothetical protein Y032_0013g2147 [Ancylostoma ceylanicum]
MTTLLFSQQSLQLLTGPSYGSFLVLPENQTISSSSSWTEIRIASVFFSMDCVISSKTKLNPRGMEQSKVPAVKRMYTSGKSQEGYGIDSVGSNRETRLLTINLYCLCSYVSVRTNPRDIATQTSS